MTTVSWVASSMLAAIVLAAGLASCEQRMAVPDPGPVRQSPDYVLNLLPGTWLREHSEKGMQVRRLLTLAPDGAFREVVRITDPRGQVTEYLHEGTWLFDGTNLKRKYTVMSGRPPSRLRAPFATFEISFKSRNDFVGVDHVYSNRVHYWRVSPETKL